MNVSGTETHNQRDRRASNVKNGTAAELPLDHKIRFMTKKIPNTILKNKYEFTLLILSEYDE